MKTILYLKGKTTVLFYNYFIRLRYTQINMIYKKGVAWKQDVHLLE